MTYRPPYNTKPMIPPITYREVMQTHVEDIVYELTVEIMSWESSAFEPKKEFYETLIKKGFQNETFTKLCQLAVDYCDYLIFGLNNQEHKVVSVGVRKAIELHLAQLIKNNGQLSALLPGARNHYLALLKEYPELKRKIEEHLSKYGNNHGAKTMSNYIQPGVPFQDQATGMWYVLTPQGQYVPTHPPQQDLTHQWDALQQRRQMRQYVQPQTNYYAPQPQTQGYPPQQHTQWGPNPNQPMAHQAPQLGPVTARHMSPAAAPQHNSYAAYSQANTQQEPAGFGPYRGENKSIAPQNPVNNPAASAAQRHLDFPPPSTTGTVAAVNTVPDTPEVTTNAVPEPVQEPSKSRLIKTPSGYECEYFDARSGLDDIMVGPPIIFDPKLRKGVYLLDSEKRVKGFKLVPYGVDEMDYEKHETAQFFLPIREEANAPNKKKTAAILADIQRKMFVKEALLNVDQSVEGNVTGTTEGYDLTTPVIMTEPLVSNTRPELYVQYFLSNHPEMSIDRRVLNFEHISRTHTLLTGEPAKEALKLRKCKDWDELKEIMNKLLDNGWPIDQWKLCNTVITDFINDVLAYRLGLDQLEITSFDTDIEELIKLLHNKYEIRNEFKKTVEELCRTSMYPHTLDKDAAYAFIEVNQYETEEDPAKVKEVEANDEDGLDAQEDELMVTFSQLSDVTILPIESSSIYLPIPEKDEEWKNELPKASTVTRESFPELYDAILDRVKSANYRTSNVVFLTRDSEVMYIKKTSSDEAFVISRVS